MKEKNLDNMNDKEKKTKENLFIENAEDKEGKVNLENTEADTPIAKGDSGNYGQEYPKKENQEELEDRVNISLEADLDKTEKEALNYDFDHEIEEDRSLDSRDMEYNPDTLDEGVEKGEEKDKKGLKGKIFQLIGLFAFLLFISAFLPSLIERLRRPEPLLYDSKKISKITAVKDDIYLVDGEKLLAYSKGKKIYEKELDKNSVLFLDKDRIYVSEAGNLIVLNRKSGKEENLYKYDSPILGIRKIKDNLALLMSNKLVILNEDFKVRRECEVEGLIFGLDFGVYTNILSLDKNMIFHFNLLDKDKNKLDLATKEVLVFNKYLDEDRHVLASESGLYLYDKNKLVKKIKVDNLRAIDYDEGKIALVDGNILKIYDKEMKVKSKLDMEKLLESQKINKLIFNKGLIYCLGEEEIFIVKGDKLEKVEGIDFFKSGEYTYLIKEDRIERYRER